jgi:hypothetical protein
MNFEELPLWADCPFRNLVPSWIQEIRKGPLPGRESSDIALAFVIKTDTEQCFNIVCTMPETDLHLSEALMKDRFIAPMVNNLGYRLNEYKSMQMQKDSPTLPGAR